MNIRNRIGFFIIIATAILMAVLYATSQIILVSGFTALEDERVLRNVDRARDTINASISDLDNQVGDWSAWDDSYQFVRDRNPGFIKKNLPDDTFIRLRLNLMLFMDAHGKQVYGKAFSLEDETEQPLPGSIMEYLNGHGVLFQFSETADSRAGIIQLAEGAMLIAARPIITSEGGGPVAGTLLMGRYLDQRETDRFAEILHMNIAIRPSGGHGDRALRDVAMQGADTAWTNLVNDQTIAGHVIFNDILEQPALMLTVAMPREIFAHGQTTVRSFLLIIFIIGTVFAVIMHRIMRRLLRTQNRHRDSEARYHAVIEQSGDGIFMVASDSGMLIGANPAFCNLTGIAPDDIPSLPLIDLFPGGQAFVERFLRIALKKKGNAVSEVQLRHKTGALIDTEISINRIHYAGQEVLCFVARDISDLKRARQEIQHISQFDALTNLPNRSLMKDLLQQSLALARRNETMVAVLLLNLDRFKIINDTLGHHAGDLLLQHAAAQLRGSIRECDVLGRFGGDEFILVMPGITGGQDCDIIARRLLDSLAEAVNILGHNVYVTPSVGITLFPAHGDDMDSLLKNADLALLQAKHAGGNAYQVYSENMQAPSMERLTLEHDLRLALERNELSLVYQPQVDLASGEVFGMEALLRWNHPALGQISPLKFIPIAEETGMIHAIGEWVLRSACTQAKSWMADGYPSLRVGVNLSARQFAHQDLVTLVTEILAETGLPASCLDLELTESMLMENMTENVKILNELKAHGIYISIDDFGTGYSSLAYLQRIPIDTIKIDRSFVRDITSANSEAHIAKAVIALAHGLGHHVIAEGVETREQLEFMQAHRCNAMQGYFFSPPLSVPAFTKMLQERRNLNNLASAG